MVEWQTLVDIFLGIVFNVTILERGQRTVRFIAINCQMYE